MRRFFFFLFWGIFFFFLPIFIVCVAVAVYYATRYPHAFEFAGIMTEGRREMLATLDRIRPTLGLMSAVGLVLGLIIGISQRLPAQRLAWPENQNSSKAYLS